MNSIAGSNFKKKNLLKSVLTSFINSAYDPQKNIYFPFQCNPNPA